MVYENNLKPITEIKKPFELVQEIENYQIKKSPLSPVARSKVVSKSGSDYVSEKEGYGPCTDGRIPHDCCCSREELIRQRDTIINNVNVYNNIQQIINIKFPSTGSIFKLKLIIENQSGHSRSKEYDSVEEATNSVSRIISGQDFPDEYAEDAGFWANFVTAGVMQVVPNWGASSKIRNSAASALQSVIQKYQNGSNINGWLKVEGRFADDPNISWSY